MRTGSLLKFTVTIRKRMLQKFPTVLRSLSGFLPHLATRSQSGVRLPAKKDDYGTEKLFDPTAYSKHSYPQSQHALYRIGQFRHILGSKVPLKVLDFGCGDGHVTQWLAVFTNIREVLGIGESFSAQLHIWVWFVVCVF